VFSNKNRLAVLMPVFNGGRQLAESLWSCAAAGLRPAEYEIIVVDNCSTDGAASHLPSRDANGAAIQVHHNAENVGRVGNWNRGVGLAARQGFRYITFLFVGDTWIANGALPGLFHLVLEHDAAIGLSPFVISDESGTPRRSSQRFYVSGSEATVTNPRQFLSTLLESGLFPLGPLQANIYRISPDHMLCFDEQLPTRTDVEATLDFIARADRGVAIATKPFLKWREHQGRFHMSMGAGQTIRDYLDTFHSACLRTGLPVNHSRAKARVMLNSARLILHDAPASQWAGLLAELLQYSRRSPYKSNPLYLVETLWLRFALGRRLLEFS
jgi:glycosyltransferase involved in cell wall biosynthesis